MDGYRPPPLPASVAMFRCEVCGEGATMGYCAACVAKLVSKRLAHLCATDTRGLRQQANSAVHALSERAWGRWADIERRKIRVRALERALAREEEAVLNLRYDNAGRHVHLDAANARIADPLRLQAEQLDWFESLSHEEETLGKLFEELAMRRKRAVEQLLLCYPVARLDTHHCSIAGVALPDRADYTRVGDGTDGVPDALGHIVAFVQRIGRIMGAQLPHALTFHGPMSTVTVTWADEEEDGARRQRVLPLWYHRDDSGLASAVSYLDDDIRYLCGLVGVRDAQPLHLLPSLLALVGALLVHRHVALPFPESAAVTADDQKQEDAKDGHLKDLLSSSFLPAPSSSSLSSSSSSGSSSGSSTTTPSLSPSSSSSSSPSPSSPGKDLVHSQVLSPSRAAVAASSTTFVFEPASISADSNSSGSDWEVIVVKQQL